MRITQSRVSPTLEKTFGPNFRKRWGLTEYHDVNAPTVFLGLYSESDLSVFRGHKGYSLVIWGGADMKPNSLAEVKKAIVANKTFTTAYPGEFSNVLKTHDIYHKPLYIPLKDYSEFLPCPLGDKIYVYKGINGNRSDYFNWNNTITPIIKHFGEDSVIYTNNEPISSLVEDYYKKSFVYIKPTPKGGCTTMFELGHMGRKTIGSGLNGLPNVLNCSSQTNIIKLIENESKFIGKMRTDVFENTKSVFVGPDWLEIDFWKK